MAHREGGCPRSESVDHVPPIALSADGEHRDEYGFRGGPSPPPGDSDLNRREPMILFAAGTLLLILSGLHPHDRFTWVLEVAPILLGVPILFATYRHFPLTPLAYRLIFFHSLILMLGGQYTYARVPLGF